jgi:uncharacterized protein YdaL
VRRMKTPNESDSGDSRARLRSMPSAWVAIVLAVLLLVPCASRAQTGDSLLVLHDNEGPYGWLGEIYSLHLENLLSHFELPVVRKPFSAYQSGDLDAHRATFYVGAVWNQEPLPEPFATDLGTTPSTFVWMGVNLWRKAWDLSTFAPDPAFEQRYGFRLLEHSFENHQWVDYKGERLKKDQFDTSLSRLEIVDPSKVEVCGTVVDSAGNEWPYIVGSGNFWVVPDMPMISTEFRNRSLVFADVLHDILGIPHTGRHRAVLRIEDVSPAVPVESLQAIRAVLEELGIPFVISLIPQYRDWSGYYTEGVPEFSTISAGTAFADEIKALEAIGGQIIQHGTTHQLDGLLNPYNGVSGNDYEFYRVTADESGQLTLVGPVPGESGPDIRRRILEGRRQLRNAGFAPVGWLTPHYLASPLAYQTFARLYPFALDRGIFFVDGDDGVARALELNAPYPYRDTYGLKRIPETIGYIDPWGWFEIQPPSLPADLIDRARALKVVRDSWAGCYFHWYLDPELLRELVLGIEELGFEFVPVHGGVR